MKGMSRNSGAPLADNDHIRQSVQDILSTPLLSRRMLPGYGSDLHQLIDNPVDRTTQIRVVMAVAVALARWEPRISIDAVSVAQSSDGRVLLTLSATDVESGREQLLENIEV